MSISINEAIRKLGNLNNEIESVLKSLGNDCSNVTYDPNDLDEKFIHDQVYFLVDKLDDIHRNLKYLSKPITEQGFIKHNSIKRYELPSGNYFTSGSDCEILVTEDEGQKWIYTSIEHNGEDYYATALGRNTSIDGMMVRVRSY